MSIILPVITSLMQYLESIKNDPGLFRPNRCPKCGRCGLWCHGHYHRKADRENNGSLNPIPVLRFFCPHCDQTCSVLPECISPRRWYLWKIQQTALMLFLAGNSTKAIAKSILPSRHTISRWMARLKNQLNYHKDALGSHFTELGRMSNFADLWRACLDRSSLGQAMRICHEGGLQIP
jgi:Domain of unknown function (DUF6431)